MRPSPSGSLEEIRLKTMTPQERWIFFLGILAVSAAVFGAWVFLWRFSFHRLLFSWSADQALHPLVQIKEQVRDITSDVKEKASAPAQEMRAAIQTVAEPVSAGIEEREAAIQTVGQIMKERLSASESETSSPEASAVGVSTESDSAIVTESETLAD